MSSTEPTDRKRSASDLTVDSEAEIDTPRPRSDDDDDDGKSVRLAELKREKRLKMNRESARKRRGLQKTRLVELESQVEKLVEKNQQISLLNESLMGRIQQLENELASSRSTVAVLSLQVRQFETSSALSSMLSARGHSEAPIRSLLHHQVASQLVGQNTLGAIHPSALTEARALFPRQGFASMAGVPGVGGLSAVASPRQNPALGTHSHIIQNTVSTTCVPTRSYVDTVNFLEWCMSNRPFSFVASTGNRTKRKRDTC